jgi:hypothetical protein
MTITEAGAEAAAEAEIAPWTETTRLLCAAAYTEGTFAQEVVEQIVEDDYRAVEMPPNVDPLPVIKHCLAAFRRKTLSARPATSRFTAAFYRSPARAWTSAAGRSSSTCARAQKSWATAASHSLSSRWSSTQASSRRSETLA